MRRSSTSGTSTTALPLRDHSVPVLMRAPVSTSDEKRSSMNSGLPSIFVHTVSITSSPEAAPTTARASSRSSVRLSGERGTLWNLHRPPVSRPCSRADTPGSGSGRRVATRSSGASPATSASFSVNRRDVGSAQCKSSKASTVGPPPPAATPLRLWRRRWRVCSASGLSRAVPEPLPRPRRGRAYEPGT